VPGAGKKCKSVRHDRRDDRHMSRAFPDDSCGDGETCQVHLVRSEENKIITVVIKKFQQDDGTDYWFVYEPTKLELSRIRIRKLKNESFENGKEAEREEQAEIAAAQEAEDEERKADNGFYP